MGTLNLDCSKRLHDIRHKNGRVIRLQTFYNFSTPNSKSLEMVTLCT